ncbi:DNA-binding NarL/FixJ family response regulator [Rhodobacter sp. JA431]|uniref:LuxR C-terminal-related transcriptional regulator n=1 Tax=Rhodobacter sp. JA431 TaxID=570013 RepID=UPI000BC5183F|nr:LuxR C-terminal-related transcriptional regulator [Rhodobacter sp. JA431]SOB89415.1 DNA-binding NarL/FixJ family response regulator [Rhodobacter sp. JA431]
MRETSLHKGKILVAHKNIIFQDALVSALQAAQIDAIAPQDGHNIHDSIEKEKDLSAVILDYRAIEENGTASLDKIIQNPSKIPIIIFGGTIPHWLVRPALKLGLKGIIPEDLRLKALPSLLDVVLSGVVYASPEWLHEPKSAAIFFGLSKQEEAALRRATTGETNGQIAKAMGLKESTVKILMRSAGQKLGTSTRVQTCLAYAQLTSERGFGSGASKHLRKARPKLEGTF